MSPRLNAHGRLLLLTVALAAMAASFWLFGRAPANFEAEDDRACAEVELGSASPEVCFPLV